MDQLATLTRWISSFGADEWTAVFTGLTVAVAAAQAALFVQQLSMTRRSLADATRAAAAAERSVAVMQQTSMQQLRAYVCLDASEIEFPEPVKPKVHLRFKNVGQTPAHDLKMWCSIWIDRYPLEGELPEPPGDFIMSSDVMGPGGVSDLHHGVNRALLKPGFHDEIGTAEATVYVFGAVTYTDVFGIQHKTKFRMMHGGAQPALPGRLKPCPEGNEAT